MNREIVDYLKKHPIPVRIVRPKTRPRDLYAEHVCRMMSQYWRMLFEGAPAT